LAKLDRQMSEAAARRDRLTADLAAPALTPTERAERGRQLKQIEGEIETMEARWLALDARIEALTAG
jgi:ATP-binding cassette subfamily F protein 3